MGLLDSLKNLFGGGENKAEQASPSNEPAQEAPAQEASEEEKKEM